MTNSLYYQNLLNDRKGMLWRLSVPGEMQRSIRKPMCRDFNRLSTKQLAAKLYRFNVSRDALYARAA